MTQAYIVGDSSPFLKRVLVPFWCIRIAVMCINIFLYAVVIVALAAAREEVEKELEKEYGTDLSIGTLIGVSVAICVIIVICLIIDIVCIVKRGRRTLSPKFFLYANIFQTLIWTVLFALSMVGVRQGSTIAVGVVIYLSFLGMLIYAAIIFHKFRKGTLNGGAYKPTQQNDAHHTFDPSVPYGHPAQQYPTAPYAPQDYSYGGAAKVQQQQQPYGQPPQYGYSESHEMQGHQRV